MSFGEISFEEIIFTIGAVLTFLVIMGTLIAVKNPNYFEAKIINTEISYISSISSNKNIETNLNIESKNIKEIYVREKENKILIELEKNDIISSKEYYGKTIQINQNENIITIKQ
ncbi:hypothetical protein EOM09_05540 [bacterium]|nr:hypothetical protein [bacterium]